MKREINDFWTYYEVLSFLNIMSNDLTYAELNLLIKVLQHKLSFKKYEKERRVNNV